MVRGRITNDRGTVLLLFPAAFLIILILAAITIDISHSQLRANELHDVASSAANDSLGALDQVALRTTGYARFDISRITQIAEATVTASNLPEATVRRVVIDDPDSPHPQLRVTLSLEVPLIMTAAIPGAPRSTTITRTGTASILGFDYLQPDR